MAVDGYTPTGKAVKRPSICHSCRATVVWALLEGKRQLLDYLEKGGGDVALEPDLFARADGSHELVRATFCGTGTHYRRHIESCPDAAKWRDHWKTKQRGPKAHTQFDRKKTR